MVFYSNASIHKSCENCLYHFWITLFFLTCFSRFKCFRTQSVNTIDETVFVVTHCVSWEEPSITQRSELFFRQTRFDDMSIDQVPMIHCFAQGIFVVTQKFLPKIMNQHFLNKKSTNVSNFLFSIYLSWMIANYRRASNGLIVTLSTFYDIWNDVVQVH